ncbi:MAG: GDSL-type esterase/lipase family protein [Verrucomicrobiota bacterium]|nr:GDSL-type esterase/lipase family protein [Verrucomicrobiota bacterium]
MNSPQCLLKNGDKIVFEGDSNTCRRMEPALDNWPYLRLSNWHITHADRIAEWLFCNRPDLRLSFQNAAVGGSSIRSMHARYASMVKPHKPIWVICTIGANDSAQKIPLADFRTLVELYAHTLKGDSNARLLVIGGLTGRFTPDEAGYQEKIAAITPYYTVLQEVLPVYDGIYLDIFKSLQDKQLALRETWAGHTICTEEGHFNLVGAEIITAEVLQALGVIALSK